MILKKYTLSAPIKIEKKSSHSGHNKVKIDTIKKNGVISEIEISCHCGEKIRIQLGYKGAL